MPVVMGIETSPKIATNQAMSDARLESEQDAQDERGEGAADHHRNARAEPLELQPLVPARTAVAPRDRDRRQQDEHSATRVEGDRRWPGERKPIGFSRCQLDDPIARLSEPVREREAREDDDRRARR